MDSLSWFADKVCVCDRFVYDPGYNWEVEFNKMTQPPSCFACKKWMNRVHNCWRCKQEFYGFFEHRNFVEIWVHTGHYSWECFDCLEAFKPYKEIIKGRTIPPPEFVLVPDRIKLTPEPMSAESQATFDALDDLLDSI